MVRLFFFAEGDSGFRRNGGVSVARMAANYFHPPPLAEGVRFRVGEIAGGGTESADFHPPKIRFANFDPPPKAEGEKARRKRE